MDQYVKREDETYQRIVDVLPNDEKHQGSQAHVVIEAEIPENGSLDTANSFLESSSQQNLNKPSKHNEPMEHYDSYITDEYVKTIYTKVFWLLDTQNTRIATDLYFRVQIPII